MIKILTQKQKAEQLRALHYSDKMLILPNIWDTLGATLLNNLGFPAIATASAAVAFTNGYHDGENIPFKDLLAILTKIVNSVNLPVTADIESGYADNDKKLSENIKKLVAAGIVGINIEDTDNKTHRFLSIEEQCHKIELIRKVANDLDIPLFINARTDVILHGKNFNSAEAKLEEIIKRGRAYKDAGADGFFPIALRQEADIKKVVLEVPLPVNILTIPTIPDLKTLAELGVARVSLGPSFLKIALKSMRDLAIQLQNYEGLSAITENDITTDYVKNLINNQ